MTDEHAMLSDRTLLGMRVQEAAEQIARRRMFSDLSGHDREELVGIAVEKYYATWGAYGQPANIQAWLSTVMFHAMAVLYRDRRRVRPPAAPQPDESAADIMEQLLPPEPSLSGPFASQDAADRFLGMLAAEDARLLQLAAAGYSHREIGEVLGTKANAVGVRLHRLRARLRELLGPEGLSVPDEAGRP